MEAIRVKRLLDVKKDLVRVKACGFCYLGLGAGDVSEILPHASEPLDSGFSNVRAAQDKGPFEKLAVVDERDRILGIACGGAEESDQVDVIHH